MNYPDTIKTNMRLHQNLDSFLQFKLYKEIEITRMHA